MKSPKSKFTDEQLIEIEKQVNKESIPYDYKTKDYPLEVLLSKFGKEEDEEATLYVPSYQREFVWRKDRQSRFIESVLLGVPLTPFLVAEDINKRLEIIDGSQRIRTLIAFSKNELRLSKLNYLDTLNSAKYKDLPRRLRHSINNRDFKVIVVGKEATIEVRRDIFDRINTTSERLTDSEIRKGAYSGSFYDLVLELAEDETFKEICPVPQAKAKRGEYEELILRFFTYCEQYQDFKHDVAIFLDKYLALMNTKDFSYQKYKEQFSRMVSFVSRYFTNGFKKEPNSGSTPRVRFESIAVGVHLALEENPDIIPLSIKWLESNEFSKHTTSDASNNKGKLVGRVEFVRDCLLNIIDVDSLTYKTEDDV